jgi:hypothetical protein
MLARILLLSALVAACNMKTADGPTPDKPAAKAALLAATTRLGDPITSAPVALSAIAHNPAAFANKTVVTSGTVTAVCQAMGCWMEITDESGEAHVKMHGHSFFVPKTASGHKARVQAIVEQTNPDEECAQEAEKQTARPVAKLQLDATGVELLD